MLAKTIEKLSDKIKPSRSGMTATHELLYSCEKTGTVVYRVFTCNLSLPKKVIIREVVTWAYFLVGNGSGYTTSDSYVHSEARFAIGEIREDKKRVTIPRDGIETVWDGIEIEVKNLVFLKTEFSPY